MRGAKLAGCPVNKVTQAKLARHFINHGQSDSDLHTRQRTPLGKGTGAVKALREKPNPSYTITRGLSVNELIALGKRDPAALATLSAASRRPKGVSVQAHGIAIRAAAGDRMITANPRDVREDLDLNSIKHTKRIPKGARYGYIVVKPRTLQNAKLNRTSGYWGERVWTIYNLKYSNGLVIVTDQGDETRSFNSMGHLQALVRRSGWEIIK